MRFTLQYCCIVAMFLLANPMVQAQSRIAKGAGDPQGLRDHDWYLDTIDGGLWWAKQNVWVHSNFSPADEIFACGKLTVIHRSTGYAAIKGEGNLLCSHVPTIRCLDTLLLLENAPRLSFMRTSDGRFASDYTFGYRCWNADDPPDTIAGIMAYCAVANIRPNNPIECNEMRTWGMIGFNGHWLIEPKYDAPFHFQNGIADVLYYGQKRKINEKGEFVE